MRPRRSRSPRAAGGARASGSAGPARSAGSRPRSGSARNVTWLGDGFGGAHRRHADGVDDALELSLGRGDEILVANRDEAMLPPLGGDVDQRARASPGRVPPERMRRRVNADDRALVAVRAVEPARRLGLVPGEVQNRDQHVERMPADDDHPEPVPLERAHERARPRPVQLEHARLGQRLPADFVGGVRRALLEVEQRDELPAQPHVPGARRADDGKSHRRNGGTPLSLPASRNAIRLKLAANLKKSRSTRRKNKGAGRVISWL